MSGLSGFWTVYLEKPPKSCLRNRSKIIARNERFFLDNYAQTLLQNERFDLFLNGLFRKTAQKPLKSCLRNRSKITARNELFLSGFFKQLRSKSCFKMSGLSGFWTVYLKKTAQKPLKSCLRNRSKITARNERFFLDNYAQTLLQNERFERFLNGLSRKTAQNCSNLAWETVQKSPQEMSGFFRQLRSKSCFKMSGLSGFWTV